MSAVNELLDNVKNRLNLGSDIALAERVGVTRSLISRWRKGDTPISDERIAQICAMAKIDGTTWMAMIHAERATSTTERALWRLILDRVSAAAAVIALVCITAPGAVKAETLAAQGFAQGQSADSVYYVNTRPVIPGKGPARLGRQQAYYQEIVEPADSAEALPRTGSGLRPLHCMPEVRLNSGAPLCRRGKLRRQQSDFLPGLIYVE